MTSRKGFAPNKRRPTKGGSLPAATDLRSLGRSVSHSLRNTILSLVSSERRGCADTDSASGADEPPLTSSQTSTRVSSFTQTNLLDTSFQAALPHRIPPWKRILDLSCVLLTLPFWLPLMVLVMLWIKIASPGPVFYRQRRVGYRRNHFMIFKFRTMHVNVDTRIS